MVTSRRRSDRKGITFPRRGPRQAMSRIVPPVRLRNVTPTTTSAGRRIPPVAFPVGARAVVSSARSGQVSDPSVNHRKQSDHRQSGRILDLSDIPLRFARGPACTARLPVVQREPHRLPPVSAVRPFDRTPHPGHTPGPNAGKAGQDRRGGEDRKTRTGQRTFPLSGAGRGRHRDLVRQPWTSHRTFEPRTTPKDKRRFDSRSHVTSSF